MYGGIYKSWRKLKYFDQQETTTAAIRNSAMAFSLAKNSM